ncbi:hypothetical protein LY76DRAFT_233075 [Colletotrichum caudatum]|nr:hypothetical protein LY76DRAFT_233075 [Colletotrichum caudatum]
MLARTPDSGPMGDRYRKKVTFLVASLSPQPLPTPEHTSHAWPICQRRRWAGAYSVLFLFAGKVPSKAIGLYRPPAIGSHRQLLEKLRNVGASSPLRLFPITATLYDLPPSSNGRRASWPLCPLRDPEPYPLQPVPRLHDRPRRLKPVNLRLSGPNFHLRKLQEFGIFGKLVSQEERREKSGRTRRSR